MTDPEKLARIAALYNGWANGRAPTAKGAKTALLAVGETLGDPFESSTATKPPPDRLPWGETLEETVDGGYDPDDTEEEIEVDDEDEVVYRGPPRSVAEWTAP